MLYSTTLVLWNLTNVMLSAPPDRYTMQKREGASETDISMVGTWRSKQQKKEQQNKLQEEENDI
jgi:hypothetical protein